MKDFRNADAGRGRFLIGASLLALGLGAALPAAAQSSTPTPTDSIKTNEQAEPGEVVVTGRRAAERAAVELKKSSDAVTESHGGGRCRQAPRPERGRGGAPPAGPVGRQRSGARAATSSSAGSTRTWST